MGVKKDTSICLTVQLVISEDICPSPFILFHI